MASAGDRLDVPQEHVLGTIEAWLDERRVLARRRAAVLHNPHLNRPPILRGTLNRVGIGCSLDVLVADDDPALHDPESDIGVLFGGSVPTTALLARRWAHLAVVGLHEWAPGRCRVAIRADERLLARFPEVGILLEELRAFLRGMYQAETPARRRPPGLSDVQWRVAEYVLATEEETGGAPSANDIADSCVVSRESVPKILRHLRDRGVVRHSTRSQRAAGNRPPPAT